MSDDAAVTVAPATSKWEDFIDIFYAPSAVYARREAKDVWLPLIVVALLGAVLTWANRGLMAVIADVEFSRMSESILRKNPGVDLAQMRAVQEKFASLGPVFVFIFTFIGALFVGAGLWLTAKLVDAKIAFGTAFMIAAFAMFPRLVEQVVNGIQWLVLPVESFTSRLSTTLGVARFLDPDSPPMLLAAVGRLDVFTLWVTALLAIGLAVKAKVPLGRAAIAAAIVWILGMIPTLLQAAQA